MVSLSDAKILMIFAHAQREPIAFQTHVKQFKIVQPVYLCWY